MCPRWCQHIIDIAVFTYHHKLVSARTRTFLLRRKLINSNIFILVCNTPVLSNLSKLKLNQVVILINQNIHVGFQTGWCIYSTRLKSQLYVVVWVGTNYKVNVVPVC